jgi:hypothetical protein
LLQEILHQVGKSGSVVDCKTQQYNLHASKVG